MLAILSKSKYLACWIPNNILFYSAGGAGSGAATATSEKVAALEQKLFKTQEELTEVHRWKSEVWNYIPNMYNIVLNVKCGIMGYLWSITSSTFKVVNWFLYCLLQHAQKITELNNTIRQKDEEIFQKEAK